MAKKKNGKRRRRTPTVSVAVVAGLAPGASRLYDHRANLSTLSNEAGRIYLGYDSWTGNVNLQTLRYGLLPAFFGMVVHKVASRMGVNRAIASAGIPVLRL